MNFSKQLAFCIVSIFSFLSVVSASETAPGACGKSFVIVGEIKHQHPKPGITVENATNSEFYVDEVFGKSFTATVPGLPAGIYTVEIYLAETYWQKPGERIMTITAGGRELAANLDLMESGFAKEQVVSGTVEHQEDQIMGPLAIEFSAKKDSAKFNAIQIKDSQGIVVACVAAKDLAVLGDPTAIVVPEVAEAPIYFDSTQPVEKRVADLVRRMSLQEKVSQLMNAAPAIDRLKLPGYDYWSECLHGVARTGRATVFPQAIGMAAAWDPPLLKSTADIIATEARAKNNGAREKSPDTARYFGLTFWTPNINIFRDPRWGRGQETYGEDPFLASRMAVAFIRGLQGDDPKYVKASACAKHFAVHSGPEKLRHTFNVDPSPRDLYETYLPQFEAAVKEGKVLNIMSAYNAVYGVPAPASEFLLTHLLREEWGFTGHVVSDCGAIGDVLRGHHFASTNAEAAAVSLKAGNDIECGGTNAALVEAVNKHLLTIADIDKALKRVLEARFLLGLFDSPDDCPYLRIPKTENDTPAHNEAAATMARESIVLLKNEGILPLQKSAIKKIALIGPNADSVPVLEGNYNGSASNPVTLRAGLIAEAGSDLEVVYAKGCPLAAKIGEELSSNSSEFQSALEAAKSADVVIFAGGIDRSAEGEEMKTVYQGFDSGDRVNIELPPIQTELLKALKATGKPIVFVNFSGGAMAMPWEAENIGAILQAWYPGQQGGTAISDVLFGKYNPAGRLPVTFYGSTQDLPAFENYSMENRTYRYFQGKPLFPFGHGLSYTKFDYQHLQTSVSEMKPDGKAIVSVNVTNSGKSDGDEIVQLYVSHVNSKQPQPRLSLAAFKRLRIAKGETKKVELELPASALRYWDEPSKSYIVEPGDFEVQVGASSSDIRQTARLRIR